MNSYYVTMKHDKGSVRLIVKNNDIMQAIESVLNAEKAPLNAIQNITNANATSKERFVYSNGETYFLDKVKPIKRDGEIRFELQVVMNLHGKMKQDTCYLTGKRLDELFGLEKEQKAIMNKFKYDKSKK